jgi:group I intron endonuclease
MKNVEILDKLLGLEDLSKKVNNKKPGVYVLNFPETGEYYLGATCDLGRRVVEHNSKLTNNSHCNKLLQEVKNLNPKIETLGFVSSSVEEAFDFEKKALQILRDDPLCKNIRGGVGYSEETIAKRAKSNTGKTHTDETKEIIRQKLKDHWSDPEQRKQQSNKRINFFKEGGEAYWKNKPINPETKKKLDAGRKQYFDKMTPEDRRTYGAIRTRHLNIPVKVDNKVFPSMRDAATYHGVSSPTVRDRINSKNFPNWTVNLPEET